MKFDKKVFMKKYMETGIKVTFITGIILLLFVILSILSIVTLHIFSFAALILLNLVLCSVFAFEVLFVINKYQKYQNLTIEFTETEVQINNVQKIKKSNYYIFEDFVIKNIKDIKLTKKYIIIEADIYYFRDAVNQITDDTQKSESVHKTYYLARVFEDEDNIIAKLQKNKI